MAEPSGPRAGPWEWGVAERALDGEEESGDVALIMPVTERTLVAVVDGLGHGREAVAAARTAVRTLERHACDDLPALIRHCHASLRHTRGAVLTLVLVTDDGALTWTGVGNVEAVVVHSDAEGRAKHEHPLLLAGVLGMQMPELRPSETVLAPGDRLLLATDGIHRSFIDGVGSGPPQQTADAILQQHATGRDDALVVVGEYRKASA